MNHLIAHAAEILRAKSHNVKICTRLIPSKSFRNWRKRYVTRIIVKSNGPSDLPLSLPKCQVQLFSILLMS